MRKFLVLVGLSSLACSGLATQARSDQIVKMALKAEALPDGPDKAALTTLLEDGWLDREGITATELSGFEPAFDAALEDGALTPEELTDLLAKGAVLQRHPVAAGPERDKALERMGREKELKRRAQPPPKAPPPPKHTFGAWTDLQAELRQRLPTGWKVGICPDAPGGAADYSACMVESDSGAAMITLSQHEDVKAAEASLAESMGTTVFGDSRGEVRERDGRAILTVTASDLTAADALAGALAPDGTDMAGLLPGFEARLAAQAVEGVRCQPPEEGVLATQACRFTVGGKIGMAILSVSPQLANEMRMHVAGQSMVGHPGGSVTVQVADPKAGAALIDALFVPRAAPPAPTPAAPAPPG